MKKIIFILMVIGLGFLFTSSCGDESSEDQLDRALYLMERNMYRLINCENENPFECNAYFSEANDLFKETMNAAKDSQRLRTAYLGAAMTEILRLNEDKEIKELVERFQNYMDTATIFRKSSANAGRKVTHRRAENPLVFHFSPYSGTLSSSHSQTAQRLKPMIKVALANPPLISEVQSVIRRKVIPAINYAIGNLVFVQQDPNYFFKVSPMMQGSMDADTLEMDMTEIKAMHAGLLTLRSSFRIFNAYNMDVPDYSVQSLANVLNKPSTFLTLYSNHELGAARTDIMVAADTLISAIHVLRSETDDQNNDIIKIDTSGGHPSSGDIQEIENQLNDIKQGLISNVTIYDVNNYGDSVVVSFKNFFTNPITDFKEKLPDYRVLVNPTDCGSYLVWKFYSTTIPDPTMNGIFPEITTSDDFKRIFDIDIDTVGILSMSAQIDGSAWYACDAWGYRQNNYLVIGGEREISNNTTDMEDHIEISIYNFSGTPGTILLGGNSGNIAHYCYSNYNNSTYRRWETDMNRTGTLTITEYTDQYIKGTFSFSGICYQNNTVINFTSGTFYVDNEEEYWLKRQAGKSGKKMNVTCSSAR